VNTTNCPRPASQDFADLPFVAPEHRLSMRVTVVGTVVLGAVVTKYLPGLAITPEAARAGTGTGWFALTHTESGQGLIFGTCRRHMESVILPAVQALHVDWARDPATLTTDLRVRAGIEQIQEDRRGGRLERCTDACVPGEPFYDGAPASCFPAWPPAAITIRSQDGAETMEVTGELVAPGLVIAPWVFKDRTLATYRFTLDHLTSGTSIIGARCRQHIEELALYVLRFDIDWTRDQDSVRQQMRDVGLSAAAMVQHSGWCAPRRCGTPGR
jgi:hypothetical protein